MDKKKKIFEKTDRLGFEMKNRIIRSATWENLATETGHMTDKLLDVYKQLSQNEVGMIITGYANIVEEEKPNPGMMGIYDDSFIQEYRELTDMIHQNGSKIVLQVAYGGTKTNYQIGERIIFAPSVVPEVGTQTVGKEMTISDINYIVKAFASSARRAKESGFDGVEIHGAHSYLINQFLSPYYNRREDQYGGTLENRIRFLEEIYLAMRMEVGREYPILVKLTASDFLENGLKFDEIRQVCRRLEVLGVNGIELSGNIHGSAASKVGTEVDGCIIEKEGYFSRFGEIVSAEVKIPLITVGGFKSVDHIEKLINETEIEYIAIARPLLTEPDLVLKWKRRETDNVKCIRCSKCRTAEGNYCVVFNQGV